MNITRLNFKEVFPYLLSTISDAHFVALDFEMSGIVSTQTLDPSLSDSVLLISFRFRWDIIRQSVKLKDLYLYNWVSVLSVSSLLELSIRLSIFIYILLHFRKEMLSSSHSIPNRWNFWLKITSISIDYFMKEFLSSVDKKLKLISSSSNN